MFFELHIYRNPYTDDVFLWSDVDKAGPLRAHLLAHVIYHVAFKSLSYCLEPTIKIDKQTTKHSTRELPTKNARPKPMLPFF